MEFIVGDFHGEVDAGCVLRTPRDAPLPGEVTRFREAGTDIFQFIKGDNFGAFPLIEVAIYLQVCNLFGDILFIALGGIG